MMRSLFHIFPRMTMLLTACVMLVACMEKGGQDIPVRHMLLQVDLEEKPAVKSSLLEQETIFNSIRIYAYRHDTGDIIGSFYRGAVSTEPIFVDLALPERGEYEVEFYVLVNEVSVMLSDGFTFRERMTREELQKICFTSLDQTGGTPLYCRQVEKIDVSRISADFNSAAGHGGHHYLVDKVTFSLRQSLAKLSVYAAMAEGVSATKIHYVGILRGGLRQYTYFLPVEEDIMATVPSRAIGRDLMTAEKVLAKHTASGNDEPSDYDPLVSDYYIQETEVGSEALDVKADDRQLTLHVQYSVGEGGELRNGYIYMPRINRGVHYNVCLLITSEGRIILSYTVAPWDKANMTELWFDYPTHSFLEDGTDENKPEYPAQMSKDRPFVGYFKMSYPENETWRPTVIGENAGNVVVRVYRDMQEVVPPVAADADIWYRIEVTPDEELEAGKEVELAITYSPDFSTSGHYEFLLINGSQNNWYWPYGGASTQDASKVIITVAE